MENSKSSAVDKMLERLAARRQKRANLIAEASQTKTTAKNAAAVATLLAGKSRAPIAVPKVTAAELPRLTEKIAFNPHCQPKIATETLKLTTAGKSRTSIATKIPTFKVTASEMNVTDDRSGQTTNSTDKPEAISDAEILEIAQKPDSHHDAPSETTSISKSPPPMETAEDAPKRSSDFGEDTFVTPAKQMKAEINSRTATDNDLEILLSAETAKEREIKRVNEEIMELLSTPSTMEKVLNERFRSQGGSQVQLFCLHGTRIDCTNAGIKQTCRKLHFRKIIHAHTDESLGDCSFLNTCFHVETCKYVHYEIDPADLTTAEAMEAAGAYNRGQLRLESVGNSRQAKAPLLRTPAIDGKGDDVPLYPPQWINCDIRQLDMTVLGKFSVIMADPPWDIHMELPYGTMSDDEMRRMDIPILQDDGYIFLWVTGRAMELGRECLKLWGYERVDELIWVKTNQLQRLIRTGRTGHWLNHGKEHCLVGMKGNPKCMNKGLDCDVIVSEVRETSRKPDEIYGIIERLSPGTRKIELFGRPHNVQANWLTLGNQLDGTYLVDPAVVERYRKRYPNGTDSKSTN